MKLIKQMIERKLTLSDEFMVKKLYSRGIWNFYCSFNISISLLEIINPKKFRLRNSIFKNILLKDKINEDQFQTIGICMNNDRAFIVKAIEKCKQISEDVVFSSGNIYREGRIGMLQWEYP